MTKPSTQRETQRYTDASVNLINKLRWRKNHNHNLATICEGGEGGTGKRTRLSISEQSVQELGGVRSMGIDVLIESSFGFAWHCFVKCFVSCIVQ